MSTTVTTDGRTATWRETRSKAIEAVLSTDGWLSQREAETLYDLARNATGPIVEIGSWRGRSTIALALGSLAGNKVPVYAIDPFTGPAETQTGIRTTSLGNNRDFSCSKEGLIETLKKVKADSIVTVIALTSEQALQFIPENISLLFVDGDHFYTSVRQDMHLYFPRVKQGGYIMVHDMTKDNPGVVKAFDEMVMGKPNDFRALNRVDSALVVLKRSVDRKTVHLACPGNMFGWGTVCGIVQSSLGAHRIELDNNGNGFDDFNAMWARALNKAEEGSIDYFAMLHSDVEPEAGWLDILVDEIREKKADLISVAIPLKDARGILSCGYGDPKSTWGAFRRLTVRELLKMPATFNLDNTEYKGTDKILLHNTGCFIVDIHSPLFYKTDSKGRLLSWFDFPTAIARDNDGKWSNLRESEDWFFSRRLHEQKANTWITRKVGLAHRGGMTFPNNEPWGTCKHGDDDTGKQWRTPEQHEFAEAEKKKQEEAREPSNKGYLFPLGRETTYKKEQK